MFGYIYLTTNLVNGKRYVGQHISKEFTESYKGSGMLLRKAFKKYGFDNFKVELIEECASKEELDEREIYWISYYDAVNSKEFYNMARGGGTGWSYINSNLDKIKRDYTFSETHKKRISEVRIAKGVAKGKKNPNYGKRGESSVLHGRVAIFKDGVSKYVPKDDLSKYSDWELGRGESVKKNISKAKTGKSHVMHQSTRDAISRALKGKPKSKEHVEKIKLINVGRKHTPEQIEKFRQSMLGEKNPCYGKICINNGTVSKYIIPEELEYYQTLGWTKGIINKNLHTNTGRKAVNNGVCFKVVPLEEVDKYISEGWELGRLWDGKKVTHENKKHKKDNK